MGVAVNQDTAYAKEMASWEATHSKFGPPGRTYVHQHYPTMMYKAGRVNDGPIGIIEQETANSDAEQRNLESLGFVHGGAAAAVAAYERFQQDMAVAAAEREHDDRLMGDKAKAEAQAATAGASDHVGEIPATPIKPRK